MDTTGKELRDEQTVAELRELLVSPETLPPGAAFRMEAGLSREVRRWASSTWGEVLVFVCIAFVATGFGSRGQLGLPEVLIGLLAAIAYGIGIRWLLGETAASEDSDEGPVESRA